MNKFQGFGKDKKREAANALTASFVCLRSSLKLVLNIRKLALISWNPTHGKVYGLYISLPVFTSSSIRSL